MSIFELGLFKFEAELREVRSEMGYLRWANVDLRTEINQLRGLVDELRGSFRCFPNPNLKFEGLSEDRKENWEQSAEKVVNL